MINKFGTMNTLFQRGHSPFVVFSMWLGRLTDNLMRKPEAEIFAYNARRMGVQKNVFLLKISPRIGRKSSIHKTALASEGYPSPKSY